MPEERDETPPTLAAHSTRPGRTVFTDPDNADAWIATDTTVTAER